MLAKNKPEDRCWPNIKPAFLPINDDEMIHPMVHSETEVSLSRMKKAREDGKLGAKKRWGKDNETPEEQY
jgi:hypothetical protein